MIVRAVVALRRLMVFSALFMLASGCSQPTELYVLTSAEPADLAGVAVVTVTGPGDVSDGPRSLVLAEGGTAFLVRPIDGDASRVVTVTIEGCAVVPAQGMTCPPESLRSVLRFRTAFVAGRRLTIRAVLSAPCDSRVFPVCEPGLICRAEGGTPRCEPLAEDLADAGADAPLPPDTGDLDVPESLDGGVDAPSDAGDLDAPVPSGPVVLSDAGHFAFGTALARAVDLANGTRVIAGFPGLATAELYAPEETILGPEGSGSAVAISDDGLAFVVGAPRLASGAGSATWYDDTGAPIVLPNSTSAADFGRAVAISGDGQTALVGSDTAPYAYDMLDGASASPLVPTTSLDKAADYGVAVALSHDGLFALVGAPRQGATGVVFVFRRDDSSWIQQDELSSPGAASFGTAVALSGDGTVALVGAPTGDGAAYLFRQTGTDWTLDPTFSATGTTGSGLGRSVALSRDGTRALVGEHPIAIDSNAASLFALRTEGWVRTDIPATGFAVALSGDGTRAALLEQLLSPTPERSSLTLLNLGP